MSKKTVSIHEMVVNSVAPRFMRAKDVLYGMDGRAWIWHEAKTWEKKPPKTVVVEVRRKTKRKWAVLVPDDVSINAGDADPETWVPVEVQEGREALNLDQRFAVVVEGMQGMGEAFQDLAQEFSGASRAIASGSRTLATTGKRNKGKTKVMVPVVDRSDGEVKIMSMSEEKAKKLKYLAGHSIADVVLDERNGTVSFDDDGNQTFKSLADEVQDVIDEDDGTETLNITDMLANKFEPKPKR